MGSFLKFDHTAKSSFKDFLLATLFIALAYVLGNIPLLVMVDYLKISSIDQNLLINDLQGQIGKTATFFLILLPWVCVFGCFFPIARYVFKVIPRTFFTARKKFDRKRFVFAFLLWFLISFIQFVILFNSKVELILDIRKFVPLVLVAFFVLFCQTTAEELVFRSFLLKWLSKRTSNVFIPIIISGTIFGLLHGSNPEVQQMGYFALSYYIMSGILLGSLAYIDNGLELPMGFHFANNLFAAIIVTAPSQVFVTDAIFLNNNVPTFNISDFFIMFGIQIVFIVICYWKYKWEFPKINK